MPMERGALIVAVVAIWLLVGGWWIPSGGDDAFVRPLNGTRKVLRLRRLIPHGEVNHMEDIFVDKEQWNDNLHVNDVLVRLLVLSADPYQRGRMKTMEAYLDAIEGFVAGEIVESRNAQWPKGTLFGSYLPYRTVQVVRASNLTDPDFRFWNLSPFLTRDRLSYGVGVLGMPGATAYGGLIEVLKPRAGEVLFVSSAAGALGTIVGQVAAKELGVQVIGSCGGPNKTAHIRKLGFHHAIDYRQVDSVEALMEKIKEFSPSGVDMNFENVGGMHFEATFRLLKHRGRVAICGCISTYNEASADALGKKSFSPLCVP